MSQKLLLKGFEVELFTGLFNGEHVGISDAATKDLSEFVREPDLRNLEYITTPESDYHSLREFLLIPRQRLRKWLAPKKLTLIPGSTLSLGNSKVFERSDPENPYHDFIEVNYGTRVVTTSVHINLGIEDMPFLFSALRLVRCEAALLLALSASSPFLDGSPTGSHSQRWIQFPLTPENVPLFLSHEDYVRWVEEQLSSGAMTNERHLWTSVRPNGSMRPYKLNRLEIRICDLITNSDLLLAITALVELRLQRLLQSPSQFDPLQSSQLSPHELAALSNQNDFAVAQSSLDAKIFHWRTGDPIICRDWISQMLEELMPLAAEIDMVRLLKPIYSVLNEGNQSMKWLEAFSSGQPVKDIIQQGISDMAVEEIAQSPYEVIS